MTFMFLSSYTINTKVILALAVISSIALGLMIIVSHLTSYIEFDFVLKWLLPAGFILLLIAFISMFAILIIMGVNNQEDVNRLAGWTLLAAANSKYNHFYEPLFFHIYEFSANTFFIQK
jgi:hypothetical protein